MFIGLSVSDRDSSWMWHKTLSDSIDLLCSHLLMFMVFSFSDRAGVDGCGTRHLREHLLPEEGHSVCLHDLQAGVWSLQTSQRKAIISYR